MEEEDVLFLIQIISSIEDASKKLEKAHKMKDYDEFNKVKKIISELQEKISEVIK